MIEVEGYKAFEGILIIHTKSGQTIEEEGQFLFKPEYNCWYGNGKSFPADNCTIQIREK